MASINLFAALALGLLCAQTPRVELDHVFIVVTPGATAEIAALRSAGLNVHTMLAKHDGQGTASVAVYFDNAYLELIWVDSSVTVDAQHAQTAQWFRAATAWRSNNRSPFGFGLRRLPGDTAPLPVPVRRDPAPWLDSLSAYELLHQPADSLAANFFVVPAKAAMPNWMERRRARLPHLFKHANGSHRITKVRMYGPHAQQPEAFQTLRPTALEMAAGAETLLEVQLDAARRSERVDLRPVLPLVISR